MIKKYDSYKDSGIEWIGEIPEHWKAIKISRGFDIIGSGTTPPSGNEEFYLNGDIPWVNTGDLNDGILTHTNKCVTQAALDAHSALKIFPTGSLIIAMYGATIGKVSLMNLSACTNQACCVLSKGSKILPKFAFYWFIAHKRHIISLGYGGGQPNISQELIRSLRIPSPTQEEQHSICGFLDERTYHIDSIIQKKQQLIALLEEEKTAVINEAGTKGLNPDAPMKDSGMEWLGKVPAHWKIIPLRYVGECQNGVSEGADYFGSGYPFVSYGDVYKNLALPKNVAGLANSTEADRTRFSVNEGDVFFTRTSETIDEIGIASTCLESVDDAVFAGFLIRFRPVAKYLVKDFSKYFFRSQTVRTFFVKEMNLVTRASLSQELLKRLPILLPPLEEQQEISVFVDRQMERIQDVINKAEIEIELLQEYRTALISEAVTGKIDVRDYQPEQKDSPVFA